MGRLELRLFGQPRVRRDGAEVGFDTRKATALLAVLAVTGREHGRDALAALLWPALERTRARATLRRTLSVAAAVGPALQSTRGGVRLDPDQLDCDVVRFQALAAGDDPRDWEQAVGLVADGFLAGFSVRDSPAFEEWQLATADALRDQLSHTLGRLVANGAARGDLAAALGHARHRVAVDPLSEPAHADLIRVTAWTGDRPGALRAYRALVRLLDRELGVTPLPATAALHEAIRTDSLGRPPAGGTSGTAGSWPLARTAAAAVPPVSGAPTLVGREAELGSLEAAWRGAAGGAALGVVGEPGIGKSALLGALTRQAGAAGAGVLLLTGHAAEQPLAFAAANDLLRAMLALRPRLASELGAVAEPLAVLTGAVDGARGIQTPGDLHRVYEAALAALAALAHPSTPLLVAVDDADLLDAASAALLAWLVRRPPPGLLLVATWTTGAGGAPLPDAVREAGQVLTLGPLDLAGVAALLADDPDPAEALRRTRGVPLLVREYAAAGSPAAGLGSPTAARELVAARLDAAPSTTRQVVGAAAVIGTVADPELLRFACGRDEAETVDAIEDAIARGLLVERSDRSGYDVPHDLVRDAALARLSLARARLLHGRVAEVLTRRHSVDPLATPAGAVAHHLAAAGREAEAGAWFLAAAVESTRLFAHTEALAQLQAARALGHRPLQVHQAIGEVLVRLGRYDEALVSLDKAAALAEADPARQAELEHAIAGIHDRLGDWALAEAHLAAARDLVDEPGSARILADLALVQHRQGRTAEALGTARQAEQLAVEDDAALAQALNVLGVLAVAAGDSSLARGHLVRAVGRARAVGDLDLLIATLNNLSRAQLAAGDEASALASGREALALAERQGDLHRLAALHSHVADLLHAAGREEEALAELRSSAAAFAEVAGSSARPEVWTLTEW